MSSVGISKDNVNSGSQAAKPSNWNLPNVLTSLRILFIPVFVWLVLTEHQWWAFGLFAVLMATDKLDGDIARARGLITDFGKIADPIADKALMTAALVRSEERRVGNEGGRRGDGDAANTLSQAYVGTV